MVPGQHPWRVLSALPAWQLTEVTRPPQPRDGERPGGPGDGSVQRSAELTSAWCRAAPVAVSWVRERGGGPVRVIAAGPALAAATDNGQDVLTLPAGARGVPLPGGAAGLLAAVPCWTQLSGTCDVLLADPGPPGLPPRGRDGRPSLEDGLLSAWLGPFAWLLLAEPADPGTVEELTSQAARAQLEAQRSDSPRAKLAERRAAARHEELRQAASAGLWRVHLLAAAATPEQAEQVAGLLRASTDLAGLPYALLPARPPAGLPGRDRDGDRPARRSLLEEPELQWAVAADRQRTAAMSPRQYQAAPAQVPPSAEERWPAPQPAAPFYGSTALVAALARVPAREVPGLRMVLRPEFDLTPETATAGAGGAGAVRLGEVLDWNRVGCGDLSVPLTSLNRHVFVCGATGAGKSQTVRNLLEQAAAAGIPWLVVEPAKAEYRLMAARLPGTRIIAVRPGDLDQPAAGINPLEPAAGPDGSRFPLQAHADLLRALFLAAFQADEPFPQVLSAALTRCYEQSGWDLVTGQPATAGVQPAYPGLEDLQAAALAVVSEIGYGREVADNVRGFVTVRIGSLRMGTAGRFLDGGHPLDFARLLSGNVVLEIEDAGDDRDKAFLMGAVLIRLTEHLRLRQRTEGPAAGPGLRHLTVIEEAHRLLRQPPPGTGNGPAAQAVEMFADLLAEVRAYGEGLVIVEQIPAKLIPDAIKNTAVKVVHRLPAADDRQAVGATMNLTPAQSQYLVTLGPGDAAVHADGMDYPLLARMPDGRAREAAGPVVTASAAPVIARRSPACGPDCLAQPCTLGQVRAAQRAAVTDPRITLWAELTVIAHLTGWDMPRPAPAFTAALRATDGRLRDCAVSHAVGAAVAARVLAISSRVSPDALTVHVTAAMRQAVSDGTPGCPAEEPQYLAPPYRWALVRDVLRTADPGTGRHPRSQEWEHAYGQPVPGRTAAQQLREVTRWHARGQRDAQAVAAVIWGTRPRTAIEQAVGCPAGDPGWPAQLAQMLAAFARSPWPRTLLRRTPAPSRATSKQAAGE
jgi:hypothetical protein